MGHATDRRPIAHLVRWAAPTASAMAITLMASCTLAAGVHEPPATPLPKSPPARVSRTEAGYEATLSIYEERRAFLLHVVPESSTSPATLSTRRRLEIGAPLLAQRLEGDSPRREWELAVGEYPELGPRIAAVAACSTDWNPKSGKPRSGEPGPALVKLLRENALCRELDETVRGLGYKLVVQSADAVVLCKWRDLDLEAAALSCRPKMQPTSLVPCGASLVFRLVPG